MILLYVLALYALCGVVTGTAFVTLGLSQILPRTSVTLPARLLWLPGAALLWPYVILRWRNASEAQ